AVAYAPNGKLLAVGFIPSEAPAGWLRLWDRNVPPPQRRDRVPFKAHAKQICCLAFAPDSKALASGGDGSVKVWEPDTAAVLRELTRGPGEVRGLAFSPDGKELAVAAGQVVEIWEWKQGQKRTTLSGRAGDVCCVAFAAGGKLLAWGDGATVRLS